jgi:hypothetical protein
MKRRDPNLTEKVCSLIIAYFGILHEYAKGMTRSEILALVDWDHDPVPVAIAVALGWTPEQYNHPSNLTSRIPDDHDSKTATVDIPAIAKAVRIADKNADFQRKILAKSGQLQNEGTGQETGHSKRKFQWPKGRKMQSRNFPRKDKRHEPA